MNKLSEKGTFKLLMEAIDKDIEKEQMEYCDEDDLEHDGPKKDRYAADVIRSKAIRATGRNPHDAYESMDDDIDLESLLKNRILSKFLIFSNSLKTIFPKKCGKNAS